MLYAFIHHLITVHKNGDIIARDYDDINIPKHRLHIYARTTNFVQCLDDNVMYNYDVHRREFEVWDRCIKEDPMPVSDFLPKKYEWLMTSTTPFALQQDRIILYARSFIWTFEHKLLTHKYPIVRSAAISINPDLKIMVRLWSYYISIYQPGCNTHTWLTVWRGYDTYIYPPHIVMYDGIEDPEHVVYNKLTNRLNVRIEHEWYSIPVWQHYRYGVMGGFAFDDNTNEVIHIDTNTAELCYEPRHVAKITTPL